MDEDVMTVRVRGSEILAAVSRVEGQLSGFITTLAKLEANQDRYDSRLRETEREVAAIKATTPVRSSVWSIITGVAAALATVVSLVALYSQHGSI